ncbi:MAG: GGDEF domain-containing protein [Deltaproteobacteria bacterium]|nr:GGDEF domain-containing protein [Deltaproteobacteria bacterium]MBN2674846.1 GGDEF domain-containing protein [Deltaproteobacteria bacterium]
MFFKKKSTSQLTDDSVANADSGAAGDDMSRDTLASVLRILGEFSLPTKQFSVNDFRESMEALAKKMLVGAGMEEGDFAARGLQKIYAEVRQQVRAQRKAESAEYSNHRQSASIIVADLVAGLRKTLEERRGHDEGIVRALSEMEQAVEEGNLDNIRRVCSKTVHQIKNVVTVQRERDQRQLEELSGQLRAMKEELLETQSEMQRDPLTEVLNRRAFDDTFGQAVDIANASAMELTLYMMDLDFFKKVNDNYGHPAGDQVLKEVGKQLIRCFPRKDDMVFRYGGEEFAILCRNTGTEDAYMLGERVRKQIADRSIPIGELDYHQTVSVGFAVLSPQEPADSLLKRADTALYTAKNNGRNRVEGSD